MATAWSCDQRAFSLWPHRVAVALACATFPLIWVGGLVTTYQAGMAVEDWPTTYGYNLFLYPWRTWVFGPFNVFVEHGHRLLGALVGIITVLLVIACWIWERRRMVRWGAVGCLALVIGQGVLGGLRVLGDDRRLALLHGCVGPAFFASAVAMGVITSRWWRDAALANAAVSRSWIGRWCRWAACTAVFLYAQIVLGARLRHLPVTAEPSEFRWAVMFHLGLAAVVLVHVMGLWWSAYRGAAARWLRVSTSLLLLLVCTQLALGGSVWVLKYGWPGGLADRFPWAGHTTLVAQAMLPSLVITAHVAMGSLLLGLGVWISLRAGRLRAPAPFLAAPTRWERILGSTS